MASCHRGQRISVTPSPGNLLLPHHSVFVGEHMVTFDSICKKVSSESFKAIVVSFGALGAILVEASGNSMHSIYLSFISGGCSSY